MAAELINPNPVILEQSQLAPRRRKKLGANLVHHDEDDETQRDDIDSYEVFDHIRDIADPEHPYSLEQLKVVEERLIEVDDRRSRVRYEINNIIIVIKSSSLYHRRCSSRTPTHTHTHPSSHLYDYICCSVQFTPTVQHCSMATLIGLCIRVKLLKSLPRRFKIDVSLTPGSHSTEAAVNKQLSDKERVAAALENPSLISMVNKCLSGGGIG